MHAAESLFRDELERRRIEYEQLADDRYSLQTADGTQLQVNLENVQRDYDRDKDRDAIVRFVDTILQTRASAPRPSWETVRPFVRYQLEPADDDEGLDDVVLEPVTDDLLKMYVYVSADGTAITWITEADLAEWSVSRQQLAEHAEANMQAIVAATVVESEDIDGVKLGMLSTEETPFKASLILSPAFHHLVSQTHGFPVYVVVPCRDFVYVLSHDNRDFLGRLGPVVIREYEQSGYPITKDVLEVSAEGIRAIGTFAPREGQ